MDSGAIGEGALVGQAIERLEDAALLTGAGRYMDDLPLAPGTLHAAILRSSHAHAELVAIDATAALALPGVAAVVTREEVRRWTRPFTVGVKQPMEHWCLAVDRVRYVGEPVAVVLADDRYRAEDALDAIKVEYRPLPAVVDPGAAATEAAPVLHPAVGGNIVSDRRFRYGDPDAAFAAAPHRIAITVDYPRNAVTPIECLGVLAQYFPADDVYEATSSFMGPFALHPVMALALKVPANRLRLKTPPESGGSFGVRQSVFPYVVLMSVAARAAGRPVKWIEDRLEHLAAATSATNRVTTLEAAVSADGEIAALRWDQLEDCGAYLRAPEPATHLSHARQYERRLQAPPSRHPQPNRAHQQDAVGSGARLRRPAGLFPARAADAAHRGDPEARSARGDPAQSRAGGRVPLSLPRRRAARFRRFPARARDRRSGWRARRAEAPAAGGARGGTALRHRLCRGGRALDLQYGLHHHGADARGAAQGRPQKRRAGDRHGGARSLGRGQRPCRLGAAGPGPSHRAGAGGGRRARPRAGRDPGHRRARHRQGRLVDRRRQLLQPLCRRGRRHGASGGAAAARQAPAHCSAAPQRRPKRDRLRPRPHLRRRQSRQRALLQPRRRHQPLGAADPGRWRGARLARDRLLDAAGARGAERGGRDQQLRRLRLHLRFLRRRNRPRHRPSAYRQIRHHA